MMADPNSLKNLARSIVGLALLMTFSHYSLQGMYVLSLDSCTDAARWAAVVTLLAGFYYLQVIIWCRCRRLHRGQRPGSGMRDSDGSVLGQTAYTDVPQTPPASLSDPGVDPAGQPMTAAHVYVYVYGWGILLFASLYCMAGLHESSSCWWAFGMFPLCFDELIMRETKRGWVVVIGALFGVSVTSIWWMSGGQSARDENIGLIMLSTVIPVMSPFIFFSLRSSVRAVTRDVFRLCELALPFMLLISVCVLTGSYMTEGQRWSQGSLQGLGASHSPSPSPSLSASPLQSGVGRRSVQWNATQGTGYKETASQFYFNHTPKGSRARWVHEEVNQLRVWALLAFTPVIAALCIHILVWSVVRGYVTEFISAFLLVLSVKISIMDNGHVCSVIAIASAGTCYILIVLLRQSV
jgi:hypothetical protein